MQSQNSKNESLLWELSKRGEDTKSYLLGTMHVRDKRAFKFLDVIKDKIIVCEQYAAEFDLNDPAGNSQMAHMELDGDNHLQELIPEKKYKKLQRILLKSFQIDISIFNRLRPIFISNLIAESILSKDKRMPLDNYLWDYARGLNKKMLGIESYEEQLRILKSIPIDDQIKGLLDIGRNVKKYRSQILKITNYYENSELSKLYKAGKNSLGKMKRTIAIK